MDAMHDCIQHERLRSELGRLGMFVYGVLMFGHSISCCFHLKRRHFGHAAFHSLCFGYTVLSVVRHRKEYGGR